MENLNKYIDHTNLKPTATKGDIEKLCKEAAEFDFASVCINPCNVKLAKELLKASDVKVCTVIGFPLGQNETEIKVFEAKKALADGCDEFDMVINVGKLKDGEDAYVESEIGAIVDAVPGKTVKVIIESGLLTDEEIARATILSCKAGADFVKTCTGFGTEEATVEAVKIMKENISGDVKIKASAGIRTFEKAMDMINAGASRLGTSSGVAIIEGNK